MKKIVSIYLIILMVLFIVLLFLDQNSNYIIEKKIWKIYKQQMDIAKDPNVIPNNSFEKVINDYRKIIQSHPGAKQIPDLYIQIGETYALRKDYEEARRIFNEIISLYPEDKEIAAQANFKIGKTYEAVDNWDEALKIYKDIIQNYPLSGVGLNAPLYIANYYKSQNDFQNTMDAYEFAVRQYKNIFAAHKDKKIGLNALRHLSDCYKDQNRWNDAINVLGIILEKYATTDHLSPKSVDKIIKSINITAAYQLKDYDIAIRIYEGIIARNPGHPLQNYLRKVIDAFNQLKVKGIRVYESK